MYVCIIYMPTQQVAYGVRWLLWKASGDRAHLAHAKRLLEELLATKPPEYRESFESYTKSLSKKKSAETPKK